MTHLPDRLMTLSEPDLIVPKRKEKKDLIGIEDFEKILRRIKEKTDE